MLNRDFKEFVELLNGNGVNYLVVGGYALAMHGRPRYTGDLDLWVRPEPANVARLLAVLKAFGFGSLGLSAEDFLRPDGVVQLGYPPARIDILSAIDGVQFDDCYARRQTFVSSGIALPLIHIDDFRANKRSAGRARDIADLKSLEDPPEN